MWRLFPCSWKSEADIIIPETNNNGKAIAVRNLSQSFSMFSSRYFFRNTSLAGLFLLLFLPLTVTAQKWNKDYQDYIDKYKDIAIEQMVKHGIPASITLAQGILESGAGKSVLAVKGNNHFGIKCHEWSGPTMIKSDDRPDDCFRVYKNARQSFEDHSAFLQRPRYKSLFGLSRSDYRAWAKGLKECGYATNPSYPQLLISLIETYNLYTFDNKKHYDHDAARHPGKNTAISITNPHQVFSYNKNYYIRARRGDSFVSLSKELNISAKRLASYNELDKDYVLKEGDVIYLKKKQKKAVKDFKRRPHVVKQGDSMYSIAQMYGIRLSSLYKKNHLSGDYQPRVGDVLVVY